MFFRINIGRDPGVRGLGQGESASYPTSVSFVSGSEERTIKILAPFQQRYYLSDSSVKYFFHSRNVKL